MKKYFLFLIMAFLCITVEAQKSQNKCTEEEFRAKKQAYIAEQAELTPEETAKFFPIYFELEKLKKEANRKEGRYNHLYLQNSLYVYKNMLISVNSYPLFLDI